jgi:hypothetical protein
VVFLCCCCCFYLFVCSFFSVGFFVFCLFRYCGFSIFIFIPIIFFLSLSILLTLPSSSSHPYSHPFHSPSFSCAKLHCSPPQHHVLPLLTHSLPPALTFPPIRPQPVTRLLLPPTHSSLTDQILYQLYTTPNPCNP